MSINSAIHTLLRAVLPAPTRIGPSTDPTKVDPAVSRVIYTRITSDTPQTDDGSSGIVPASYQLDIFAPTLEAAQALLDKLRKNWVADGTGGIAGYRGTMETIKIDDVAFDSDSFQRGDTIEGSSPVPRLLQDFTIVYRESTTV